jgi:arylsulfatase/arylsulfatase A
MRGMKSEVYEGGVRSPFFAHWPGRLPAGVASDRVSAHIDVMPTILAACGVAPPAGRRRDGRSLLPLLEGRAVQWPDRTLVIQAHRGDEAVRYHNFLARSQRWKLLCASGFQRELERVEPRFELYDMQADPLELVDAAAQYPDVVADMRAAYDAWFDDVGATRPDNYAPPRIHLGSERSPEVVLTRQDWRRTSDDGGWGGRSLGRWEVLVVDEGPYRLRVRFPEGREVRRASLRLGEVSVSAEVAAGAREHTFDPVGLPLGPASLETRLEDEAGACGAYQVIVSMRTGPASGR